MTQKSKARLFFGLLILMITYVGFVFYVSEPTYSNIKERPVKTFDFVAIPDHLWHNIGDESAYVVETGIVLQTDGETALVCVKSKYLGGNDDLYEIKLKDHGKYRIIGEGTFYHKVNHYVGFNLMIITQFIIGILLAILSITQVKLLSDLL